MEGLACAALAERTGFDVPTADMEAALLGFRAEHALQTEEAAAEWLTFHELDVDDLGAYLARKLLRTQFADRIEDALAEAMIAPDEVMARVPEEAALGGTLRAVIAEAALRMAAGSG